MARKDKRPHDEIDDTSDEELDIRIDPDEEEDVPGEEEEMLGGKGKGTRKTSNNAGRPDKGKGKGVPDEDKDGEDNELQAMKEENRLLQAQLQQLLAQHKREMDRADRPTGTAGAGSSNVSATSGPSNQRDRRSEPSAGCSKPRQPQQATTSDHHASSDDEDNNNIRIPPPFKKEDVTIEEIQKHLGLTDSRKDHLKWLEWRERIRSWSTMANLDSDLTWKGQDPAKIGTLVTIIRDRIPQFQRFVSNWGAEYLVQDYFNHYRGHRLKKAREEGSSPPKKKPRTATTNTGRKQTDRSPQQAGDASPNDEDEPRVSKKRPKVKPRAPPKENKAHDDETPGHRGGDDGGGTHNHAAGSPRPPPQGQDDNRRGNAGGTTEPRNGGSTGRGLDIPVCPSPPPSLSTRSRTRENQVQIDKAREEEEKRAREAKDKPANNRKRRK